MQAMQYAKPQYIRELDKLAKKATPSKIFWSPLSIWVYSIRQEFAPRELLKQTFFQRAW